jgi:hypothetical protein
MIMPPKDMVDAALMGLDQGERFVIPGLQEAEWKTTRGGSAVLGVPVTEPRTRQTTGLTPDQACTSKRIVGQFSYRALDYNNRGLELALADRQGRVRPLVHAIVT